MGIEWVERARRTRVLQMRDIEIVHMIGKVSLTRGEIK